MKRLALAALLLLTACSQPPSLYLFIPQIEFVDGSVPKTNVFPFIKLQDCLDLKHDFDKDMAADPKVLSSRGDCIRSKMELKKPTAAAEEPGHTAFRQGSI